LVKRSPTQLYWLLTLHITPLKLLYSSVEHAVIKHTFLQFDQTQKPQIFKKSPDKTEKHQIL